MLTGYYKYWLTLKISWANGLVYRTNLLLWRLRSFLSTLMSLTVWNVIFSQQTTAFNYQQSTMITYIFLVSILQNLILSTTLNGLASTIYSGQLSFEMLKPINIYLYLASQDIADKLKNVGLVMIESGLLYLIFQPQLSWPQLTHGLIFIGWALAGVILSFIINLLFGAIGFWSPESWGPRFLFFIFIDFTAGKLYPLDILPALVQRLVFMTPFPYLSYAQVQLFLGRLSQQQIVIYTAAIIGWTIILGLISRFIWKRGFKNYSAAGQ